MPIITTAEYKTYIGETTTDQDAVLDVIIPAVQDDLEKECGRKFDEATYTDEAYDGKGQDRIWLKNIPVTALTAVKTIDSNGTSTTLATTEYRLSGDMGRLTRLSSSLNDWGERSILGGSSGPVFPDEDSNVLVSYTGGYGSGAVPAGLKLLMYTLVDSAMDRRGEDWSLAQSGDGVIQRSNMASAEYQTKKMNLIRPWTAVVV
jgi:hypothetical protein